MNTIKERAKELLRKYNNDCGSIRMFTLMGQFIEELARMPNDSDSEWKNKYDRLEAEFNAYRTEIENSEEELMSSEIEQLETAIARATKRIAELKAKESSQNADTWPKCGDTFWSVNEFEDVSRNTWSDHYSDFTAAKLGNVFRTEDEATEERERRVVLTELRKLARESWGGTKVNWENCFQEKWCLRYVQENQRWYTYYNVVLRHQGAVYFASRAAALSAIKTIGAERLMLLI